MIKTNCELPISLLNSHNVELNDFDLVLFHLYISEPEYKKYFDDMRENHPERRMILDNSAYEFFVKGEELNLEEYEKTIKELNPDYYILPDVLMDKDKTISGVLRFAQYHQKAIENYFKLMGESAPQPIAVVQGNTVSEFNHCLLKLLKLGYTNIAIPFHNSFFKDEIEIANDYIYNIFQSHGYTQESEDMRYAYGRCKWLERWGVYYLFDGTRPMFSMLHFLGSHCPVEKKYYNMLFTNSLGCDDIVSMDTGYPVKCAIEGVELEKEEKKPNIIIDDFMHNSFSESQVKLIENNVNIFKKY